MYRSIAQIAVPVLPFPELQCTTITCLGFSKLLVGMHILTLNPHESFLSYFVNVVEGRPMMVRPVVVSDSVAKILLVVCCSFRCVDDPTVILVLFVQKGGDL